MSATQNTIGTQTALEASADAPERIGVGRIVLSGTLVIALFFGVVVAWAGTAPIDSAALAPGVVIVSGQRRTVEHLEGGIVSHILAFDGDYVEAGQPLLQLDATPSHALLKRVRSQLRSALAIKARLIAERDEKEEMATPAELSKELSDPAAAAVIEGERRLFAAQRQSLASRTAITQQRIAELNEEIVGLEAEIVAQERQLRLIVEEINLVQDLVEKGLARRPRLLALQRSEAEIVGLRSRNKAMVARAKQSIAEATLEVEAIKTARLKTVAAELPTVESTIDDLRHQLSTAQDIYDRTIIRAPVDGTVVGMTEFTIGGVIGAGVPILHIVPKNDQLVVEARVDPSDIDVVHQGLQAKIRLIAFNQRYVTPIDGHVVWVSADRLTDERSGQPYYLARVELARDAATALTDQTLFPGMQAEVMIVTGARTALEYFFRPILESMNRAFREQ